MILRLRTCHYRFIYTFASGHQLIGTFKGDNYTNQPDTIFNLRSLKAVCLSSTGRLLIGFDDGFGQCRLSCAETIVSGSHSQKGSFFSINYRNGEACVYDAIADQWITAGWQPERWQIEALSETLAQPQPPLRFKLPQSAKLSPAFA